MSKTPFKKLKQFFAKKLSRLDAWDLLTGISIISYGIIFSYFCIQKHYGFASFGWDLGIADQSFYTTLFNGKLLYSTAELYMNPSGCYFAEKFSPILFILLPFYAISPSSTTLLILKSFILSLGALPLYFLSTRLFGSKKASFFMVIVYLLHPGLQSSNSFDFQQQIFIPFFVFSLYYFMIKKRWRLYFLCTLLTLMIEEHVAAILFLLALCHLLTASRFKCALKSIRSLRLSHPSTLSTVLLTTMALSVVWYFIARYIRGLYPIAPEFLDAYRAVDTFRVLGFKGDILSMPIYLLMNPERAFGALLYEYDLKLFYTMFLFAPVLFLPFRSKISIVTFILLAPMLLSNYSPYYMLGAHYPLYILPLIFLATLDALSNQLRPSHDLSSKKPSNTLHMPINDLVSTLKNIVVVSLILIVSVSPISPIAYVITKQTPVLWYAKPYSSEHAKILHDIIEMVPSNASILTQNNLFPHFSNRINAYVIPPINVESESAKRNITNYIKQQINKTDFILLDLKVYQTWTSFALSEITKHGKFKACAFGGSAVLFKKNYNDSAVFVPYNDYEVFLGCRDFFIGSGQIIKDETSKSGYVAYSQKRVDSGTLIYGPYVCLPPGTFNVTFEIKMTENNDSYIGTLDVSENYGESIVSRRDIYGFELQSDEWVNFTLPFTSTKLRTTLEFRAFSSGVTDIYIDRVIVRRISSVSEGDFGLKTFTSRKLSLLSGYISKKGFLVHQHNVKSDFFWCGPYTSLPSGSYKITFFLKTLPLPDEPDEKILTLDVTSDRGKNVLTTCDVYSSSFLNNNEITSWCELTIQLTLEDHLENVEFRGVNPSPNYDMYLAFILVERLG
jgi:uncharacterized membrane protein